MTSTSFTRRPSASQPSPSSGPLAVVSERFIKSRFSDQSLPDAKKARQLHKSSSQPHYSKREHRPSDPGTSVANSSADIDLNTSVTATPSNTVSPPSVPTAAITAGLAQSSQDPALADELDYITVSAPTASSSNAISHPPDKASRILGIRHRKSMEPIPALTRNSIVSTRSAREAPPSASFTPTSPLTSLYVVSGLPKSPHTWTLADPDSVLGLHHSEGAVNRWWRPEVLGSTVSPGAGGGKKKKRGKGEEVMKGAGALTKQEVGKMLSKALKVSPIFYRSHGDCRFRHAPLQAPGMSLTFFLLIFQLSFTREVEIIASTLQPASTIHTFTFTLPAPNTPLAPSPSGDLLRASVLSATDNRSSAATFAYPYTDDPFARPSSAYLGPPSILGHGSHNSGSAANATPDINQPSSAVAYHGVCLTVWSHADAERSSAIRRTLEAGRSRKESAQSLVASRLKNLRADVAGVVDGGDPTIQARRSAKKSARGPWADVETDGETEGEGAMSESDFEIASTIGHGPGESTLFLPGDTVFWLPYALSEW